MNVNTEMPIADGLRYLGLAKGNIVLVHSSLSALGQVEGGAAAVVRVLLDVVGTTGTILMPSFQKGGEHDLLRRGCVFDLSSSSSEMGLISETFRLWPGVRRSLNPTHCTAALGVRAEELLEGHQNCIVSVGKGSPYDKLVRSGGYILLLGVNHSSNTTLHLVENLNGAPTVCRELFNPVVIDTSGRPHVVPTHPHMPGLLRRYTCVESELLAAGIQVNGQVGLAEARLIRAQPMAELLGRRIRENPLYLCEVFTP